MAYTKPIVGAVGAGGAKFGAGSGGPNRFDYTQWGGGLWASGIDANAPTVQADTKAWYDSQAANVRAEVDKYFTGSNASQKGTGAGLVNAVDWRQRDVARKIQKENGFLDSAFGKILVTAAQIGVTLATGNPYAATAIGAATGAAKGGLKGALFGGLSGYGVGTGTQFVASGGLTRTFNTLLGKGASSSMAGVTQNAAGYLEQLPASTAKASGGILSRAGAAFKGATSGLNTAVSAVNAGVGLKNLLAPAGAGAAIALGAAAASTPNLDVSTPATPAETKTDYEMQVDKERKRRRLTQTDVTWGMALNDPKVRRPTLLGGATKLAA